MKTDLIIIQFFFMSLICLAMVLFFSVMSFAECNHPANVYSDKICSSIDDMLKDRPQVIHYTEIIKKDDLVIISEKPAVVELKKKDDPDIKKPVPDVKPPVRSPIMTSSVSSPSPTKLPRGFKH
jgi:hypothetical protein